MVQQTDLGLRKIAQRLHRGTSGRGRRSALFWWMYGRADGFEKLLDETRPSWQSVAEAMADLGLRNGSGNPANGECCRQTWLEVRRARAGEAKSAAALQGADGSIPYPALMSRSPAPSPDPVSGPHSTDPGREDPDEIPPSARYEFKRAKPR